MNVGYYFNVQSDGTDASDKLLVKGMTNPVLCPQRVSEALLKVDGVFNVSVDFASKMVLVWGIAEHEDLVRELSNAGFAGSRYKAGTVPNRCFCVVICTVGR